MKVPLGFPNQTIIYSNSIKIFYTDNDENEGPLHMNFTLNYSESKLGVYQKIGENIHVIDEMDYKALYENKTI